MKINSRELYFIQEVFNQTEFNSRANRFELPESAYDKVDFSDEVNVKLFEKLCKQYNIYFDRSLMFKKNQSSAINKTIDNPQKQEQNVEVNKEFSNIKIFDEVEDIEEINVETISDKDELCLYLDNTFIPQFKNSIESYDEETGKKIYIPTIKLNDLINLGLSEENVILAIEHFFDLGISVDTKNSLNNDEADKYKYLIKSKFYKDDFGQKTNWKIVKPLFEDYKLIKDKLSKCNDNEKQSLTQALRDKKNEIFFASTRLVNYYVMKHYQNDEVPEEDIKQMAYMLLDSYFIDKFDVTLGYRFSTFLYAYLGHHLDRMINEQKAVRIPVHAHELMMRIEKTARIITEIKGSVTPDEIALELDIPVYKVVELMAINRNKDFESLTDYEDYWLLEEDDFEANYDGEYNPDSYEKTSDYESYFVDEIDYESLAYNSFLKEQIKEVLKTITPREAMVLSMRFGLDDGQPKTLEEIGKLLNVNRERIRQIEAKALHKLRHPSRSNKLKDFYDLGHSR